VGIARLSFRSQPANRISPGHGPIEVPLKTADPPRATLPTWIILAGGTIVVVAAVAAGLAVPGHGRTVVLIPVAIALGLGIVALAVARFELFVASILLVRASLDAVDLSSSALDASGAISVLFVAASVLWLLAQRGEEAKSSPTAPLIPPVTAVFAFALLSVTVSSHPLDSLFEVVRFGTLIVIVSVLGRLVRDARILRLILLAAVGSSIVPVLVAARQITGGGGVFTAAGLDRIRGTFLHSNPFAAYLFLMITLMVSLYPHVERRWRLALVPLTIACGGCLIATYSRGAWVATIVALVVIGLVQDRRILWMLGGAIVVVVVAVPSVGVRLSDLSETQKETGAPGNSLIWRLEYWRDVLALQDNPVLGIGFKEVEQSRTDAKAPHNDPIRIFVETGIVGFAAYVWLLITLGMQARSTLRRAPPGLPRGLAVAFAASFTGLLLLSLTANVITQLVILWYFVTIVALAMVWAPAPTPAPVTVRT
jgi:putative inorganic carbon (HCO3(-)) transporter